MKCPFCDPRLSQEGRIAETEHFYSIYNLKPVFPGHCMVIPHAHLLRFGDLIPESRREWMDFVDDTVQAILAVYGTESYDLIIQEGPDSGRSIEHLHTHILPRQALDIEGEWYDHFRQHELSAPDASLEERTAAAARIREAYPNRV